MAKTYQTTLCRRAQRAAPVESMGAVSYNLLDAAQNNDAAYMLWQLNQDNALNNNAWNSFTEQSSHFLVDYSLGSGSSNVGLQMPDNWLDPIGALNRPGFRGGPLG